MTQNEALTILKTGANVFLTGEPGSGKSYTINEYVRYLRGHEIEPEKTQGNADEQERCARGIGARDHLVHGLKRGQAFIHRT